MKLQGVDILHLLLDERIPKNLGERRGKQNTTLMKWHSLLIQRMVSQRLWVLCDYPCAPTTTSRIIRVNRDRLDDSRIEEAEAEVLALVIDGGK
jgi:hypothetical protein